MVTSRASLDENQIGMLFNVCSAHIAPRCAAPLAAPCGGAGFCAPVCGGAIGLPDAGGNPAMQEGRAWMVQGKGGEGGTGGARFELGPTPRTASQPVIITKYSVLHGNTNFKCAVRESAAAARAQPLGVVRVWS